MKFVVLEFDVWCSSNDSISPVSSSRNFASILSFKFYVRRLCIYFNVETLPDHLVRIFQWPCFICFVCVIVLWGFASLDNIGYILFILHKSLIFLFIWKWWQTHLKLHVKLCLQVNHANECQLAVGSYRCFSWFCYYKVMLLLRYKWWTIPEDVMINIEKSN